MKRFAKPKDDTIVEIPAIIGISPIAVEPTITVGVTFDIPNVRIAIGISLICTVSPTTPLFEIYNVLRVEFYV